MTHTTITITAKTWDEERAGEVDTSHAIAQAKFTTEWAGDISGTSTCWLLISYVDGDPADAQSLVGPYTGYEQVEGTLDGRSGTFVLAASGEHSGGVARTDVTIVADSGTGAFEGITGSGSYSATAMEYALELDYELGVTAMDVTREQVLAYRVEAHGLHRSGRSLDRLAVLDIGVQDGAPDLARLAFDARLPKTPDADLYGPGKPLALAWTLRGAPHVHRRADLDALAAALYPLSETDAGGRINESGPAVKKAGIDAMEQFTESVAAMRAVVTKATAKGAVSTAVTAKLPSQMRRSCRSCGTTHISDSAMRAAFLPAGLELEPDTSPPVLRRRPKATLPKRPDRAALRRLILAYLTLLGPATEADVADYCGVRRADLGDTWPSDDLVEVQVGKRKPSYLPAKQQKSLASPKDPDAVRLLSGIDPYLQARDRDLLVPDTSRHKKLWPVMGRPGALLVDGEIAGTWRTKASGQKLTITVEPFGRLAKATREDIDAEAERVAAVRGLTLAQITVD